MPNRHHRRVFVLAVVGSFVTGGAGCDPDRPPVASAPPAASTTTVTSTTSSPATCVGQPVRVSFTPVSTTVEGATATYPVVRVEPVCAGLEGSALQHEVTARVADARGDWTKTWQEQHADSPDGRGYFDAKAAVPVNVPGLVVVTIQSQTYTGGPYPNTTLGSVALNTSTGKVLTREAMLAELQAAGGPGWNFERELRRAAHDALPSAADAVTGLQRDDVSFYPTEGGLAVSADGYFPHAVGPAHFTIPWSRLVGSGDDLSFVPDAWGH